MKNLINAFTSWLPMSVAIIIIYATMYLAIQQYIRLSANEVLVQNAIDTKEKVEKGILPSQAIMGTDPVDIQKSLIPFTVIYDIAGKVQASSATLHGSSPTLPAGVLEYALKNGENRGSWQPEPGVRHAIVVLPYLVNGQQGYVVAGRSLREVEIRERFLRYQIISGIVISLVATYLAVLIVYIAKHRILKAAL